ncbi:MAG: gamma-glutamyltransferase family protein [Acidimicrobiia bacterium]
MLRSHVGTGACAVSPDYVASQVGLEVMEAGGNAVDAAVAVNAVLGVVRPTDCGIGGDLFVLVHRPGDPAPTVLNASGRAGSGAAAALRAEGLGEVPYRHRTAVTVPGCVDGWLALLERFGSWGLSRLLEPAIRLAEEGFAVSPEMALNFASIFDMVGTQPSAYEFYPDGISPSPGSLLTRPAMARTLREIAQHGRDGLYAGRVAAAIEEATGGVVTGADLAANAPDWVTAERLDVLGETGWTIPPNSQGYITLATLGIFEQLGSPRDFAAPDFHHLLIEAYRAAAWDRGIHLADSDHMTISGPDLLHPLRLAERAFAITSQSARWPASAPLPGGTAYLCTVDGGGMGVSFMQSNFAGIGSGISAGDTGVWLHNRGAGFTLEPGHPNELVAGKRPAHTLAPTLWTRDGQLSMLLGSRGGDLQPQLVAQLASDILYLGMDPTEAQASPRWALDEFGPGDESHPQFEDTIPSGVVAGLIDRGHAVVPVPAQRAWGPVSIIRFAEDGTRHAAADPRVSTAAVAAR